MEPKETGDELDPVDETGTRKRALSRVNPDYDQFLIVKKGGH